MIIAISVRMNETIHDNLIGCSESSCEVCTMINFQPTCSCKEGFKEDRLLGCVNEKEGLVFSLIYSYIHAVNSQLY